MHKRKVELVTLKYVDGSTSATEVIAGVPTGVLFDPNSKLWWIVGNDWWGKTHLGEHQLYTEKEGQRTPINFQKAGAVIGLYDLSDPKQAKALEADALEAIETDPSSD
ncbi:MAG: hypothetical protein WCO10_03130 [bacterium]